MLRSPRQLLYIPISILAPARGATNHVWIIQHIVHNFNPRSREGSDGEYTLDVSSVCISILAPARGATGKLRSRIRLMQRISILAPARGATAGEPWMIPAEQLFQSSLPRGERQMYKSP